MDITLLVSIIVVVALLAVSGFYLVRTRRSVTPGKEETRPEVAPPPRTAPPEEDRERDEGAVRTPPAQAPPVEEVEPETPAEPAAPEVETPPPSAGRMVRLRARLARSQRDRKSVV